MLSVIVSSCLISCLIWRLLSGGQHLIRKAVGSYGEALYLAVFLSLANKSQVTHTHTHTKRFIGCCRCCHSNTCKHYSVSDSSWQHDGSVLSHAGSLLSHAGSTLSHAGSTLSHAGTVLSHAGRVLSHAGTVLSHAGNVLSPVDTVDWTTWRTSWLEVLPQQFLKVYFWKLTHPGVTPEERAGQTKKEWKEYVF